MARRNGAKALVVEDDAEMRFVLERVLARSGVGVVAVDTAESARAALRAGRFDVVITDMGLPGGEDGGAVVDAAVAHALPILVVSASPASTLEEARRRQVARWLRKPCTLLELRESVGALVGNGSGVPGG